MNVCKTCGEALKQDGTCPACVARLERNCSKSKKHLLIIGVAAVVTVIVCAFLIGWLINPADVNGQSVLQAQPKAEREITVKKEVTEEELPEGRDMSGTCGENIQWSFRGATGELTITGEGEMEDYEWELEADRSYSSAPWGKCNISSVEVHGVTAIGAYAFYCCNNLETVNLSDSVTTIGDSAFADCISLTAIKLPSSVTTIEERAFGGCKALTSVELPDSVTHVGDGAFSGCNNLMSVKIPCNVTSLGGGVFSDCENLIEVEVDEKNQNYKTIDGVLFTEDGKTLVVYPKGRTQTTYEIPDGVTTIGENAFYWCDELTSVGIPDSVKTIEDQAFFYCDSLTAIEFPDSVTTIGGHIFGYCSALTSIVIPDGVTAIGPYAFHGCDNLTSVAIPDSVTNIGLHVFEGCKSLYDIYYGGTEEQWNEVSTEISEKELAGVNIHFNS